MIKMQRAMITPEILDVYVALHKLWGHIQSIVLTLFLLILQRMPSPSRILKTRRSSMT